MSLLLGVALCLVVIVAMGIALASFFGLFVKVVLIGALVLFVVGWLARGEEHFARWYDTTRLARWLAGPPTVTMVTLPPTPKQATDDADRVP